MAASKRTQSAAPSVLERLLSWGSIGIVAVLPLLYFPGRVASYVTSKEYFLIGSVEVLLVLWLWLMFKDVRYRLHTQSLVWLAPLAAVLLSFTGSAMRGVDPATSFFSTVESGTGLVMLYAAFVFTCIASTVIRVQRQRFVIQLFQATFFASVVLAIATYFTGISGWFDIHSEMLNKSSGGAMMGNSLLAGAYFIFSVFLSIVLITKTATTWKKIMYCVGIGLILISPIYCNAAIFKGIPLSHSYFIIGQARIATVALVVGLLISLCVWLWTSTNKTKRTIGIAGMSIMLVGAIIAGQQVLSGTTKLHAFFVQESGNRVTDWHIAWKGIQEKPLLGWGPENYHVVYQRYFDPIVFSPGHGNEAWALHPHSNLFEILVNGGVIGGMLYLIMILALFYGIWKLYRTHRIDAGTFALWVGMLIAFIVQQQMIYDSIVSYLMLFLMIGIVAGLQAAPPDKRSYPVPLTKKQWIIGTIITMGMIPVWIYSAYLPAQKVEEWQQVALAHSDQRASQYQHLFHSAGSYSIATDPEFYTDPLFYSYSTNENALKSTPEYQKIATTEIAALIDAVQPIWQKQYDDYHLTLSLLQLENLHYYLSGNAQSLVQADTYAARGFALSPTDPQLYVDYAQTMVYEHNIPAAKTLLDKAIVLNPDYAPAVAFRKELE